MADIVIPGLRSFTISNRVVTMQYSDINNPVPLSDNVYQLVIPNPEAAPIAISRIFARIHWHWSANIGAECEVIFAISRLSDRELMGGVVLDLDPRSTVTTEKEKDFTFKPPSYFKLEGGDQILVQSFAFGPLPAKELRWGIFGAVGYELIERS